MSSLANTSPVAVSVIVPMYNVEDYLDECLSSLACQTFYSLQVLLVDDGSTDNTRAIAQRYVQTYPYRFELYCKENGGQGSARNFALAYCRGEYVGFTDADDYCAPQMFERLYETAKRTDADKVFCGYQEFSDKNGERVFSQTPTFPARPHPVGGYFVDVCANSPVMLYRMSVIKESGVLFPEGIVYEDLAFHVNLLAHVEKVEHLYEPLYFRRWHEGSTMTTMTAQKVGDIFAAFDAIGEHYEAVGMLQRFSDELEYLTLRILLCSSLGRIGLIDNTADRKRLFNQTARYIKSHCLNRFHNSLLSQSALGLYLKSTNRLLYGFAAHLFARKHAHRTGVL